MTTEFKTIYQLYKYDKYIAHTKHEHVANAMQKIWLCDYIN